MSVKKITLLQIGFSWLLRILSRKIIEVMNRNVFVKLSPGSKYLLGVILVILLCQKGQKLGSVELLMIDIDLNRKN